jgi:hypothetical protein
MPFDARAQLEAPNGGILVGLSGDSKPRDDRLEIAAHEEQRVEQLERTDRITVCGS